MAKVSGLTVLEEAFCHEYIKHRIACKAAEDAGYKSPADGWKILRRERVKEFLLELSKERNKRLGIDKDWVLAQLVDQYQELNQQVEPKRSSKTGKPIRDDDGNPVFTKNYAQITKILETIGKLADVAAFDNNVNINVTRDEEIIEEIRNSRPAVETDEETVH